MTNLAVIENKVSAVRKYLKILEGYKKYSREEIENDINIRGALERYLYLAIQAGIDLAEALIAYRHFRKPTTLAENFHILQEEGIITPGLTQKLTKMTGFRNVIAHDYEAVNYDIVYDVLHSRLENLKEFIAAIEK